MELRKAEAEVGELRLDYENLRLATVTDAPPDLCLSSVLPPLLELLAQVQQDRPVPIPSAPEVTAESAPEASNGTSGGDAADGPLPPSVVPRTVSSAEALEALEQTRSRLDVLKGKCAKFRKRLSETDPVTNAPRYGSKTAARVLALLDVYDALTMGVSAAFVHDSTDGIADTLRQAVKQEEDRRKQAKIDAHDAIMKEAADAKVAAQRLEEEERLKVIEAERERVRREAELHQQAFEARQRREEEEARARAAEREADRAYQDSIPKGADGIRAQLTALRESCSNEAGAFDVAIGALHTDRKSVV